MAETVNLPRDSTLRELVAVQKASIIASGNAAAIDRLYGSLVRAAKSVEEVNTLFVDWWNICWKEGVRALVRHSSGRQPRAWHERTSVCYQPERHRRGNR